MARTKAQKNEAPGLGHNGGDLSERNEEILFYVDLQMVRKARAALKAAQSEMKRVGKVVKADLGVHGMTKINVFELAMTEAGAASLRAEAEAIAQAMRFAGTPSGYQFDLLEDRTPLIERAAIEGRKAGLLGDTLNNPYNEGSAEGQAYGEAWQSGQADLFKGIRAKEDAERERAELVEGPGHDEGGDLDDEAQAA